MTLAWFLEKEATPEILAAHERVDSEGAVVPQIWHFEVRNSLVSNERRGRMTDAQTPRVIAALDELPITTDTQPDLDVTMTLARVHRLTFYDALYLELARRRQATLLSLDTALLSAASAEGLPLS